MLRSILARAAFARLFAPLLCLQLGVGQAVAGSMTLLGVGKAPSGGGGSPSCSFAGSATDDGAGTTRTYSINIGAAAANRLVIVGAGVQNSTPTSITAAGVTLNQDVNINNGNSSGIYSALVTSGSGSQNIVVSGVGGFVEVGVSVWTCTGLSSNVVKQTGSSVGANNPFTVSVTAGDFLFAVTEGGSANSTFTSSTQTPTAPVHNVDTTAPVVTSAEWITISSTNASFSVAPTSGGSSTGAGATYR